MTAQERNVGLDLIRTIAIICVLVFHTRLGASMPFLGLISVELFFVLSGFLIAQMVEERFDGCRSVDACRRFLVNRWVRTFPLYYLTLAVYWLVACYGEAHPFGDLGVHGVFDRRTDAWPFLVFAQNLTQGGVERHHEWFGISWSLAVEEWFYLAVPFIFFFSRRWPIARVIVIMTLVLLMWSIGGRLWRYSGDAGLDFDDMYRRTLIFRLDTFCLGMVTYAAMRSAPRVIETRRLRTLLAGLSVLIAATCATGLEGGAGNAFLKTVYLSTLPAGVALMLPALVHLRLDNGLVRAALRFMSTRTYALYLSHGLVALAFEMLLAPPELGTLPLLLACEIVVADFIYRSIERPILRLRDKGHWVARSAMPVMAR